MPGTYVRLWTSEEFLANRDAWQRLLARSSADSLFMSWDWISCWWRHHGAPLEAQLNVLGVYSKNDELCGLAPLYLHRGTHRRVFQTRRLEFLGNAWRNSDAVFSEYLDIIAADESREAVCSSLHAWLLESDQWDELVLCNVREQSHATRLARLLGNDAYLRVAETLVSWSLVLPASFGDFVTRLSSGTRRKLLHQRTKLTDLSCEEVVPGERRPALERLERFVAGRWGGPISRTRAAFHLDLLERLENDGLLRLTELRAGGNTISVLLNLRMAGTEYYLQSGFDDAHARGLSPGYLHLGFAIEAACRDQVQRFDFLGGRGLHRDYKRDLAAAGAPLHCLHIVRKPSLRILFRIADRLRGSEN